MFSKRRVPVKNQQSEINSRTLSSSDMEGILSANLQFRFCYLIIAPVQSEVKDYGMNVHVQPLR